MRDDAGWSVELSPLVYITVELCAGVRPLLDRQRDREHATGHRPPPPAARMADERVRLAPGVRLAGVAAEIVRDHTSEIAKLTIIKNRLAYCRRR